ncbi:MAG: hypothetical protein GEU78_20155, partial [Actinobacteria bacterium]|nr:hypothetical protein [Actinomycetota bacterium]
GYGDSRVIGVEGAGSYGAGLARHLLDVGEDVYEVPAFLSYRERNRNPGKALAAASPTRRRPPSGDLRGCRGGI